MIISNRRRFLCPNCGKTFYEDDPFSSQYSHISEKTVWNVLELAKNYNETFRSIARKVSLSVTEVIRIFDEHVQVSRNPLSTCIAIDEFYFSRKAKNKYALMILSLDKGYVIDILESREKRKLWYYFRQIPREERNAVRYVSIDMNENYKDVINYCFPDALICVDPFHVIKNISAALNDIRLGGWEISSDIYTLDHENRLILVPSAIGLTEKEFTMSKAQLKGSFILGLESAYNRMSALGHNQMLLGKTIPPEETIAAIEKVSMEDVAAAAHQILTGPRAYAVVGRHADKYLKYMR